jgi:hypothetical protein
MKRINLPKKKQEELQKLFGTSQVTVWSALNYVTNSPLAERIRAIALEEGGVVENRMVVPADFCPNCEMRFEHDAEGVSHITQVFQRGVSVEYDCKSDTAEIVCREGVVKHVDYVGVQNWANIAFEAQCLAEAFE